MRTFVQCGFLTLIGLDLVILVRLTLWPPTQAVRNGPSWVLERLPVGGNDYAILAVILCANMIFGFLYVRYRSRKS